MHNYKKVFGPFGEDIDALYINDTADTYVSYNDICVVGATYTLSFYVYNDAILSSTIYINGSYSVDIPTRQWTRVVYKFNATTTDIEINFGTSAMYVCLAMLEKGSTLTEWETSPMDNVQTQLDVSSIQQTADNIKLEVSKKVNSDEIISSINQTAEAVTIDASKINLNGAVSANGYFTIGTNGVVGITGGSIELTDAWSGTVLGAKTCIDSKGIYTEQVLNGLAFDFRGDLFNGLLIYPANKTDLSSETVLHMTNKTINLSEGQTGLAMTNFIDIDKSKAPYKFTMKTDAATYSIITANSIYTTGTLGCAGKKTRVITTADYGDVLQSALESPTPTFADYGEGHTDEYGNCRVYLEDKFIETIDTDTIYTILLTKYGKGDIYVSDRQADYFEVAGTPGLAFAWQVLATQRDYNSDRLEDYSNEAVPEELNEDSDLFDIGLDFLTEYEEGFIYDF